MPVFPFDSPSAVDDALQKRLEEQLRARLPVLETLHPVLRVFPEEVLKGRQQLIHL